MQYEEIYAKLRELAPSVSFSVSRDIDQDEDWDGDGPDPQEEGYLPYDITVTAVTIIGGNELEGNAYLGGSYYKEDEPIGNMHGYLPQMLEEAADDLADVIRREFETPPYQALAMIEQLDQVRMFLKAVMKKRYEEQRAEIEAERAQQKG